MYVSVRSFPLLFAAVAALIFAQQSRAQTSVSTDLVGYNTFALPAGNSVRVNTFVQQKAFQGIAASITSAANSVVTVSGTGNALTSGSFNENASGPAYYLEVLGSGSTQGLIVDVLSNDSNTITVDANLSAFGVSGTTSFCVRPHTTLSSMFPATTTALTANVDEIKLFFPNNTSRVFMFTGTGSGWVESGTPTDAGGQVIYPGQGFIIMVQTAENVPVIGSVKSGPTIIPLYPGAINLVGTFNPNLSGTQTLSSFNFPATFVPYVDVAKPFNDTGLLQSPGTYLSNGTNMLNAGTFVNSDLLQVNPSNAVIVNVGQYKNWVMPSFYTSGQ